MKYNPGHIDLSGLPRAIDFDAQVARNREIIKALPEPMLSLPQDIDEVLDLLGLTD